jgi:hypothetical protein
MYIYMYIYMYTYSHPGISHQIPLADFDPSLAIRHPEPGPGTWKVCAWNPSPTSPRCPWTAPTSAPLESGCGHDVAMMGHVVHDGEPVDKLWHTAIFSPFEGWPQWLGRFETPLDGLHTLEMIPLVGSVLFSRSNCYVFQGREWTTDRLDPCLERYDIFRKCLAWGRTWIQLD